jgi:hypothetical protein
VAGDRWNDFVEWARHARAKPTFDLEERDYRLGVAGAVRELIDAGLDGRPLRGPATAVLEQVLKGVDNVVPPRQVARLADWAAEDEQGLARALRSFSEAGDDPEARLGSFVAAIARGPGADQFAGGGLIVASLLNFGVSPERLPIVPVGRYGRLPELLGEEGTRPATAADAYRRHLAFAGKVQAALVDAGVPVRDMLDVESLIALSSAQEGFWAREGEPAGSRRSSQPEIYLSICSMYRNEARYLTEWIEFHRLVGVERFFLLDNESDDESLEVLAPYIAEGIVVRYQQPGSARGQAELDEIKMPGFQHCIDTHGAEVRWMAFIDTDEYLFSPTGRPVPELLAAHERWPAVAVNSVFIGASGHVTRPDGLVLENYTKTLEVDSARLVKSIVDPARVTRCVSAHRFEYTHAAAVDENGYPVPVGKSKSLSVERLRLNHYFARSEEDVRAKHVRRVADRGPDSRALPSSDAIQREHASGATDEAAMRYLPALREALARRASTVTKSS